MNKNTKYYIFFNNIKGIGPKTLIKLINFFENIENLYKAKEKDLRNINLKDSIIKEIIDNKKNNTIDKELEENLKFSNIITQEEENFPEFLKNIEDPPIVLFYKGKINKKEECVSIVGSRKHSEYGKQVTIKIAEKLINRNITIVSGLAMGIDSIAHQTCINNKKRTIAVLPSGLDFIYPQFNNSLSIEILNNNGLLITEFPINSNIINYNFHRRNRIISGLSKITIVTEAEKSSGSMITVKHALNQGKDVYVVPGSIFNPFSKGTNNLIKEGANPITDINNIYEEIGLKELINKKINNFEELNEKEIEIINLIQTNKIEKIYKKYKTQEINQILSMLEIKGYIIKNENKYLLNF
ncbi:DNA-protecting protein DprA [bacterium]|nr:DNA-protecting protein DprA [bacterium]